MAKIYAIANQKGGVGKSTTCFCLATGLSEEGGKRVLMVDLDPQAGLTTSLGLHPESLLRTVYNALVNPEEVALASVIIPTKIPNVSLAPANLDLAGAEVELFGEIGWDRAFKEILFPVQNDYDYILADCPPSLGILTTNALMAAEQVIIPVQSEYLALRGLKQLHDIIHKVRKKGNPILMAKILRTMHNPRTIHSQEVAEEIKNIFGSQVYEAIIKRTIKFADSTLAGEPILIYAKDSDAAHAYRSLAREVLVENE
jgi:chromosome partitioning protein